MARIIPVEEAAQRYRLTEVDMSMLARAGRLRVRWLWGRRFVDPREIEAARSRGAEELPPRCRKSATEARCDGRQVFRTVC